MELKPIEEEGAKTFWGDARLGDPLWEEWILEREVVELLEKSQDSTSQRELWVLLLSEPNDQNRPLLLKIAASIGFGPSELRICPMASKDAPLMEEILAGQQWFTRKILFLGVCMPYIPPECNVYWASAPDLTVLNGDENARKLLWNQIKTWRNEQ